MVTLESSNIVKNEDGTYSLDVTLYNDSAPKIEKNVQVINETDLKDKLRPKLIKYKADMDQQNLFKSKADTALAELLVEVGL